jgi:hypothetical protein
MVEEFFEDKLKIFLLEIEIKLIDTIEEFDLEEQNRFLLAMTMIVEKIN